MQHLERDHINSAIGNDSIGTKWGSLTLMVLLSSTPLQGPEQEKWVIIFITVDGLLL